MDKEMRDEAVAFDMPNNMAPKNYNEIRYGNQHVPRPSNNAAKVVNAAEVLNEVMHARK